MEQIDVKQLLEDPEKGREFIRKGLVLDVKAAIYTLNQVLQSPEMQDAYVESQWRRFVEFSERERLAPELPLNGGKKPDYLKPEKDARVRR